MDRPSTSQELGYHLSYLSQPLNEGTVRGERASGIWPSVMRSFRYQILLLFPGLTWLQTTGRSTLNVTSWCSTLSAIDYGAESTPAPPFV